MAFGRILDIYVGPGPGGECVDGPAMVGNDKMLQLVGFDRALGIEPLHADAEIHRSNRMDRNTANIKIMNLREDVRKWLEISGNVVRVDIGYEDEGSGTVFLGQIHKVSSTLVGSDWVTELQCYHFRAKGMDFETLLVAVSYDPGTNLQTVLEGLGQLLNVPVLGANVSQIELENGFVEVGPMKRALTHVSKTLADKGYGMFYDLGEIFVYQASQPITMLPTINLSLATGLIKAKWVLHEKRDWRKDVQTAKTLARRKAQYDKVKSPDGRTRAAQAITFDTYRFKEARRHRVELQCLATHLTRPNCPVLVEHPAITGTENPQSKAMLFVADDINLKVSNYGNEFDMTIFASRDPSAGAGA